MLSNGAAGYQLADVMALLNTQLANVAAMQEAQTALKLNAVIADGTVDARGQLVKTVIDRSYLGDHDFEAAQAASRNADERVAEVQARINKRHRSFPSFPTSLTVALN